MKSARRILAGNPERKRKPVFDLGIDGDTLLR
jgi:hypothetical protein